MDCYRCLVHFTHLAVLNVMLCVLQIILIVVVSYLAAVGIQAKCREWKNRKRAFFVAEVIENEEGNPNFKCRVEYGNSLVATASALVIAKLVKKYLAEVPDDIFNEQVNKEVEECITKK